MSQIIVLILNKIFDKIKQNIFIIKNKTDSFFL